MKHKIRCIDSDVDNYTLVIFLNRLTQNLSSYTLPTKGGLPREIDGHGVEWTVFQTKSGQNWG